jgi:bifunctional non-homologous end joining protein LigD
MIIFCAGGLRWSDMAAGSLPLIRPMLAALGELPAPPGWGYEFKWDGVRVVVYLDRGRIRVASRNDRDVTGGYPELRALLGRFPRRRVVLVLYRRRLRVSDLGCE